MTSKTFVSGTTIDSDWLNDVNDATYAADTAPVGSFRESLESSAGASLVGYLPAGTGAVATDVQSKLRESVSVLDYGAVGDGVTDDSAAFQYAFNESLFVKLPALPFYLDSPVTPQGNSTIIGTRGSSVLLKDGNTNGFDLTGLTGVTIKGIKFSCKSLTGTLGGINGKAAIYLSNSAQCTIEDNLFFNIYNTGIRLYDSSSNKISNNYFGDWYTTGTSNDDTANIFLMGASSYNLIDGNKCLGANAGSGVAIHDYYLVGKQPIGNIVTNNRIDNKKAYGILLYTTLTGSPTGYDCQSIISGNVVSNIYGSYVAGNSGAGIYLQGAGGTICTNNTVYNTCISTTTFGTLAMAGITASITDEVDTAPIIVSNNNVHVFRGPGIWATSSLEHGIHVQGNTVKAEDTTTAFDTGIRMTACSNSNIIGNTVYHKGAGSGIYVDNISVTSQRLNVSSNQIRTTNAASVGLVFDRTTSGSMEDVVISGNTIQSANRGLSVSHVNYGSIRDNKVSCTEIAFYVASATYLQVGGNVFRTSKATDYGVIINDGIGCNYDKSNVYALNTSKIAHYSAGTGTVEQYTTGSVPPVYGYYLTGDRVINRAGTVGAAKAWRCTTSGEPG